MAVIKYKLIINSSKANKIEKAQEDALFLTADALKTEIIDRQVMPFDVGTMQGSMEPHRSESKRKVALITEGPYALRLYYHPEYNFQTTNNPNARGLWLEDYLTGSESDFIKETFAEILKGKIKNG